jgi:hypothetical protein
MSELPKLSDTQRLLFFLSGVHTPTIMMPRSAIDRRRQLGFGYAVLVTGIFSGISAGYAFFTMTKSIIAAVLGGILWSTAIMNFDSMLLAGINSVDFEDHELRRLGSLFGRVVVGVLIAVSISVPLELLLVKRAISKRIAQDNEQLLKSHQDSVAVRFAEIDSIRARLARRSDQLRAQQFRVDSAYALANCEGDGTCGSGIPILGDRYQSKMADARRMESRVQSLQASLAPENKRDSLRLSELELLRDSAQQAFQTTTQESDDFLERYTALERIKNDPDSPGARSVGIGILLLILVIELMPILLKTFYQTGAYDYAVHGIVERAKIFEKNKSTEYKEKEQRRSELARERADEIDKQLDRILRDELEKTGNDAHVDPEVSAILKQRVAEAYRQNLERTVGLDSESELDGRKPAL